MTPIINLVDLSPSITSEETALDFLSLGLATVANHYSHRDTPTLSKSKCLRKAAHLVDMLKTDLRFSPTPLLDLPTNEKPPI